MIRYLIAMPREAEIFEKVSKMCPAGSVEIIGIGAVDMRPTDEDDVVVNIGYAGGYRVPVGALVEPIIAVDGKKQTAIGINPLFPVERRVCFTCDEFVTEPLAKYRAIYDMELYKIARMPHKKLYSIKIVSDSLNERACESFNLEDPWRVAAGYIAEYVKEDRR